MLQSDKVTENTTKIDFSNLPSATYFLKVIAEDQEIKSFKIIKN